MNKLLNGTGWGESPTMTLELDVPDFMRSGYIDRERWESNYNDARIAEAVGRERRKARIDRNYRRNVKLCTVGFILTVLMLATVGTIWG